MKFQVVATLLAALAGSGLALPSMGASPEDLGLVKRELSAAQCGLCCVKIWKLRGRFGKRDVQEEQDAQDTQDMQADQTCGKCEGRCLALRPTPRPRRPIRAIRGRNGRTTVEVTNIIAPNQGNIRGPPRMRGGGFWVRRGDGYFWIDRESRYWAFNSRLNSWRMGGLGRFSHRGSRWVYTFVPRFNRRGNSFDDARF